MSYSEEKISRTCNINEAYENLANDIVKQAVVDYKEPLRKLMKNPNDKEAKHEAERIERFFHSGWYTQLTGIDGDWLIRKTKEMVKEEIREKMQKKAEQLRKKLEKEEKAFRRILQQILSLGGCIDLDTLWYLEHMEVIDDATAFDRMTVFDRVIIFDGVM